MTNNVIWRKQKKKQQQNKNKHKNPCQSQELNPGHFALQSDT